MAEDTQVDDSGGEDTQRIVESKARAMGWIPKEQFKGDPERFVEAGEYIRRGEELMPILRHTAKKQADELSALRNKLAEQERANTELRASIDEVKAAAKTIAEEKAVARKAEVSAGIKAAREAGDVDKEIELSQELTKLNTPAPSTAQPKETTRQTWKPSAELVAWQEANPWFGAEGEEIRTAITNGISAKLRKELGDRKIPEAEFYATVSQRLEEYEAERTPARAKVNGSRASGGSGGSNDGGGNDASYSSLPKEAKEACNRLADRVVGPNKAFKTLDAWRANYAKTYAES